MIEFVSDIAIFVLKRDVKLQLTHMIEFSSVETQYASVTDIQTYRAFCTHAKVRCSALWLVTNGREAYGTLWSPYVIGQTIVFLPCDFFLLLLSSSFFSSPNLSGRRLDVYHTSTHGVALVRI